MNIVPIAFAFGSSWLLPAGVCLSSLLENAATDTFYDIFILHPANDSLDRDFLAQIPARYPNCRLTYRVADTAFDDSYEVRGISTMTYYRLLIPDLIPEYDKILYSDVDVIFRHDLAALYQDTELGNHYVAGVNALADRQDDLCHYYQQLGLDPSAIIYAGNIVINSALMRRDRLTEKFRALAGKQFKYQDLDILNIVCKDRILYMKPDFCLTVYFFQYRVYHPEYLLRHWSEAEIEEAAQHGVLHYNGNKPWAQYAINFDVWWEYYRRSPFFDEKFYFDFYYDRLNILDQLPLWKRVKLLVRYFVYGIRKV